MHDQVFRHPLAHGVAHQFTIEQVFQTSQVEPALASGNVRVSRPQVESLRSTHPYVPTDEGWLYLAALKDLHTCEIVGWAMGSRMTQTLVADALRAAYWRNKPKPGLLHHSDRGSQYCSHAYRALQASYGMQTSMSRKGNCWERAACPWGAMRRWKVSLAR